MTAPNVGALSRYLPLLDTMRGYRRRDFERDTVAGIVVGIVTVPQAVAFAFLAGVPPEAGLYGCLLPTFLYALLGTSRQLSVGPVAIGGVMVAAVLARHGGVHAYPDITAILGIEVAVCLWLIRIAQLGGVVNLLSQPVLSGFINAAALLILVSQLRPFLGLADARGDVLDQLASLTHDISGVNLISLVFGFGALAVLWVTRRYGYFLVIGYLRRVGRNHWLTRTGPLFALALSIACVAAFDLDQRYAVATVGSVPSGLPTLTLPPLEIGVWLDVFPSAGLIALVVFVQSYSLAATFATRTGRRIHTEQELLALGAVNLGGALIGAIPSAGSFSRSGVNFRNGARTQVSSVVSIAVVLAALWWLTPLLADLPHAVLAAIVMAAVADMIDLRSLRDYWSFYPTDTITHVATMVAVLLFGVEIGLLAGVLIAIGFFIRHSSMPNVVVVGRVGGSSVFRNVQRYDTKTHSHVAAVRVDENLYFANANEVESRLMEIAQRGGIRHLLLVCSSINFIDTSGLAMLQRVNNNLSRLGIRFHLSDVKGHVMDRLEKTRFAEQLTGSIFFSTDLAMRDLEGATE
jgi:SulP family sulfate permease